MTPTPAAELEARVLKILARRRRPTTADRCALREYQRRAAAVLAADAQLTERCHRTFHQPPIKELA